MRSCFTKLPRIVAALLTCMLFAILTDCSSTHTTPPPVLVVSSGSGQSTTVGTAFSAPLVALVTVNGKPSVGVAVIFTAPLETTPPSAPSCKFANGTNTETDTTDANGMATSSLCTADIISGGYSVAATTLPAAGADFSLTNTSGPPTAIAATSGTPQTATVSTAFANPLVATVTDVDGNLVSGASVTFTAPALAPTGTFANGKATETDITDANGNATSSTFTADATAGSYTVTATVTTATGVKTANFLLTNK
jgi:hypothetical protein